ncbi:hypothetical protein HMPREF0063_11947 [Aeromicrobium marinum DSM 15272]|uniref:Uncharacterized protein n=1 Tax=Aeromicrobium marinum DSM 15272 TaxID=585531 RepID=E2SE11_9ACTN|nr:hypothetical protein [Aeromicrobium marinum]EFQ82738.1 hypothetical protein HMPREF0063_11947 [Aeromicrobium marinum DSM 15272]
MSTADAKRPGNGIPSQERIDAAGRTLAYGLAARDRMTPREAAEAAHHATNPYTVDELEDLIRADRGLPPLDRARSA